MTKRIYYLDCYQTSFEAAVLEAADHGRRIYLDSTAFYPASGGQPHDLGLIGGQPVLDVIDEGERIAHLTAGPVIGGKTAGTIDWPRRYDHMQQHTGQHLLSAVFVEQFGLPTLSFHLGADVSTIELGSKGISAAQIEQAENRANDITREARPVTISFEPAESIEGLRKPSARSGALRVISIEGLDRSACGGTHVRSTAEVGPIQIRRTESIRGNVRVEFVCGARASARARQDYQVLTELMRLTAAAIADVPGQVAKLRDRLAVSEKDNERLLAQVGRMEGEALFAATPEGADGIRRVMLHVACVDNAVRTKLQVFAAQGRSVAVAIGTDPPGVLVACSLLSGLNAGGVLKTVLSAAGARGGGSATLAQGSLPSTDLVPALARALGFESES